MPSSTEIASLILVGMLWGCTNPLMRKGSQEAAKKNDKQAEYQSLLQSLTNQISKFRNVSVWLPYAMNQAGSLLFYYTLSQSDLSLAVPAGNALSLVFSLLTSWWIGEPIHRPVKTAIGAALVMGGVGVCLHASQAKPP